jgi:hypothetical protein
LTLLGCLAGFPLSLGGMSFALGGRLARLFLGRTATGFSLGRGGPCLPLGGGGPGADLPLGTPRKVELGASGGGLAG